MVPKVPFSLITVVLGPGLSKIQEEPGSLSLARQEALRTKEIDVGK